jgi:hypothetical protein
MLDELDLLGRRRDYSDSWLRPLHFSSTISKHQITRALTTLATRGLIASALEAFVNSAEAANVGAAN